MLRTYTCGELRLSDAGKTVTLTGWVQRSRDLGGMTFIDLRDRYGLTQLAFNMETNAELCMQARKMGREFVVLATGKVIERSNKKRHNKSKGTSKWARSITSKPKNPSSDISKMA